MNNKGQALVEFVLILPVFIMILFVIVDFGMIFSAKSSLENQSSDIIEQIKNKKSIDTIQSNYDNLEIELVEDDDKLKVTIKDYVDIITPGLNRVLGDPYQIKVERIIIKDAS